jgi:predicted oxidoreductase
MKHAPLRAHGPSFSQLAFGTWRLFDDPETATPDGLIKRLRLCLDLGITTIDTAEIYGLYRVEELLGQALALDPSVRAQVQIVTKAGIYVPCEFHPNRKTAFYNSTAERLVKSAEKSLRFLGVDALDLFLVHRPDWLTSPAETGAGLDALIKSGKARSVGVSNFTPGQCRALQAHCTAPITTNQVQFNPFHLDPIFDGTFDLCAETHARPMAWSPLGGGRLFKGDDAAAERVRATMDDLAAKYNGATHDQLAYAWALTHGAAPLVITGTNQPDRLRLAAASTAIDLNREDWYALTEAARGAKIP